MVFSCDICDKSYTKKRNLKRHVSEKHDVTKFWNCSETGCTSKFVRRSYLVSHLEKFHKVPKAKAREIAIKSEQNRPDVTQPQDVQEVSDDDSIFDLLSELDGMEGENINSSFMDNVLDDDKELYMPPLEDISDVEVREPISIESEECDQKIEYSASVLCGLNEDYDRGVLTASSDAFDVSATAGVCDVNANDAASNDADVRYVNITSSTGDDADVRNVTAAGRDDYDGGEVNVSVAAGDSVECDVITGDVIEDTNVCEDVIKDSDVSESVSDKFDSSMYDEFYNAASEPDECDSSIEDNQGDRSDNSTIVSDDVIVISDDEGPTTQEVVPRQLRTVYEVHVMTLTRTKTFRGNELVFVSTSVERDFYEYN